MIRGAPFLEVKKSCHL